MHWQDNAIILNTKKYGESSAIITLLTQQHGLYKAMTRGVTGKKNRGIYQTGNVVEARWSARLAEQLGTVTSELSRSFGALVLQDNNRLLALCTACTWLEKTLPEREPHPHMYDMLHMLLEHIAHDHHWQENFIYFELELLRELGFGLDISSCAATGELTDLCYVSPKSGRAVSAIAGEPYKEKLLPLPSFLLENSKNTAKNHDEIKNGLALTGYFLNKWLLEPNGWHAPTHRERLMRCF